MSNKTYKEFPLRIVLICNAVNIAIYTIGAYLLALLGMVYLILYLIYCLYIEARVLKLSCRDCYYFGKLCAFGKGKICSWLFKRGTPERFTAKGISWKDIVPDFLVSVIPLAVGIFLLVRDFSWMKLSLVLVLLVLSFPGTAFVRGEISCKFCKQREIGCPAEHLFDKKKRRLA